MKLRSNKEIVLLKTIIFTMGFPHVFITLGAAASALGNALLFFTKRIKNFCRYCNYFIFIKFFRDN